MRNSTLIKALRLLTNKELKDFQHFLNSPLFNRNKKCIAFYQLLSTYAPNFVNKKLDDPNLTNSIYTNKRSLATLMNDLYHRLEEYLMFIQYKNQTGTQEYFLLEELRKRGAQKHFDIAYNRSLNKFNNREKDIQGYYEEYLIEVSKLKMLYQNKAEQQILAEQLKKSLIIFDKYILCNHLWLDNTVYNIRDMDTSREINTITENMISNSEIFAIVANQEIYKEEPLIQLHLLLRKLLLNKEEDDYINLFNSLKANHSSVKGIDYSFFYKFPVNYCIEKIMEGNLGYYRHLLDVYLFSIDIGVFQEGEFLDPSRMRNLIVTSVKSGEIELSHQLLDKYLKLVNPIYQPIIESYCRGYLFFQQKKYDDARESINKCIDAKSLFELDSHTILYKIYYETNVRWAFHTSIRSFRARLSRIKDRHPKDIVEGYINFFTILKQIFKKKTEPNYKKTFDKIRSQLSTMRYLSDKQWLLEKIKELEG